MQDIGEGGDGSDRFSNSVHSLKTVRSLESLDVVGTEVVCAAHAAVKKLELP